MIDTKKRDRQKLEDDCSTSMEIQGVYFQVKKRRENVCSLVLAVPSKKDFYPIRVQTWQRGNDRGLVALWGLSAMHKSRTWKSYKDWHWIWHCATAWQAVCVKMRGNSHADNGKNIRHNFVSQSLPHQWTICRSSDSGKLKMETRKRSKRG